MLKKFLVITSVLFLAGSVSMASEKKLKPGKYAKICSGGEGVLVTILPLEVPKDQALIRIKGIEGDWDNKIVMHKVRKAGDHVDYVRKYQGKDFVTIAQRDGQGGAPEYQLWLPDASSGILMGCSIDATSKDDDVSNIPTLLSDYSAQEDQPKKK